MKKLLSVAVAAAFAATGLSALAQDKKGEVKSSAGAVTTPAKGAVTTGGGKPVQDKKGVDVKITPEGKRKTEAQRTEKKK
jgi:hypothetical protein